MELLVVVLCATDVHTVRERSESGGQRIGTPNNTNNFSNKLDRGAAIIEAAALFLRSITRRDKGRRVGVVWGR